MNKVINAFIYFYFIAILFFINTKFDKIAIAIHMTMVFCILIRSRKFNSFKTSFKWMIVLVPYLLFVHFISSTYDFLVDKRLLRNIIFIFGIYSFVKIFSKNWVNVLRIFINVLFLNTIMTYIQYFNIFGLRYKTLALTSSVKEYWYVGYRAMGLMDGYDLNGIVLSLYSILIIIYMIKNNTISNKVYLFIISLISFIGIFFAARTGVIIFIIMVLVLSLISLKEIKYNIFKIISYIILLISFFIFTIQILSEDIKIKLQESMLFIFEGLINYIKYGDFSTYSTSDLIMNHYFLPDNIWHFLFGNGLTINSDSGFIQSIFKFGVIGSFIIIAIYISVIIKSFILLRIEKENNLIRWIIKFNVAMIISFLIACVKGPYFYSERLIVIIIYTVSIIDVVRRRNYECRSINNNSYL